MKQTDPQFKLRIPQPLKDRLESAASNSRRSLTAEILARLEESFAEAAEPRITTRIRRKALSGEESDPENSSDTTHELTNQQIYAIVDEALKAVLGGANGHERPTLGPQSRRKHPRK